MDQGLSGRRHGAPAAHLRLPAPRRAGAQQLRNGLQAEGRRRAAAAREPVGSRRDPPAGRRGSRRPSLVDDLQGTRDHPREQARSRRVLALRRHDRWLPLAGAERRTAALGRTGSPLDRLDADRHAVQDGVADDRLQHAWICELVAAHAGVLACQGVVECLALHVPTRAEG